MDSEVVDIDSMSNSLSVQHSVYARVSNLGDHEWEHSRETRGMPLREYSRIRSVPNASKELFPFCIVWCPIPVLTWILPFVGHLGICDSRGVVYDFAGPYHIGIRELAFGRVNRYLPLYAEKVDIPNEFVERLNDEGITEVSLQKAFNFDRCVDEANTCYSGRIHNLVFDNCHSHVARAMNNMNYDGQNTWNMIKLAAWMFFKGKYVDFSSIIVHWLPFVIIVVIITVILD